MFKWIRCFLGRKVVYGMNVTVILDCCVNRLIVFSMETEVIWRYHVFV
jgi:hypothetical protein